MVLVTTNGLMAKNILDIGKIMTCMVSVFINIKMGIHMKDCMKMIKKQDMEYTSGLMDVFIEDIGIKENNMD